MMSLLCEVIFPLDQKDVKPGKSQVAGPFQL